MDRRAFMLFTFAGVAAPGPAPFTAPPAPEQSLAPTAAAVAVVNSADTPFEAWMRDYIDRTVRAGAPSDVIQREFEGLTPDPRVNDLDGRQSEFSKPLGDYVKGVVNDNRIAMGRQRLQTLPWLPDVEAKYGVPKEILISIWAVETGFGAIQGDFDVLRSLATLAAAGRRRDWAEGELNAVIKIIATGQASRSQLKGSWAGAMGQTQFEPSTYLEFAVDGDGDGRRDIWTSPQDALASTANLMVHYGWKRGERAECEVILPPGFDYGLAEGPSQTPLEWAELGAVKADGGSWGAADANAPTQLILPSGAYGPAFLIFPNHMAIRKYNNSTAYALSVGLLAERIAGAGPLHTPWPYEIPLSLADRIDAQTALAKLGFDPGSVDGVIGARTRVGLRAWQKSKGIPADAYLSVSVLQRLRTEAGLPAASAFTPQRPADQPQ
jgi:membrane-bound lytic murein transglycosylase B